MVGKCVHLLVILPQSIQNSKFAMTDMWQKPVDFFYCSTRASTSVYAIILLTQVSLQKFPFIIIIPWWQRLVIQELYSLLAELKVEKLILKADRDAHRVRLGSGGKRDKVVLRDAVPRVHGIIQRGISVSVVEPSSLSSCMYIGMKLCLCCWWCTKNGVQCLCGRWCTRMALFLHISSFSNTYY